MAALVSQCCRVFQLIFGAHLQSTVLGPQGCLSTGGGEVFNIACSQQMLNSTRVRFGLGVTWGRAED